MLKAIVTRGEIRPLEPLPGDWQEGRIGPIHASRQVSSSKASHLGGRHE
jgi:hypothetical protein